MEQAEKYLYEKYTKYNDWRYYPPSESTMVKIMESYAQQIREDAFSEGYGQGLEHATIEEQAKTRETAIEFVKWMDKQGIANLFRDNNKKMDYFDTEKMFDKFTNKAQHCSECGKPMEKKEIIIKGDIDTCDDCLCPE